MNIDISTFIKSPGFKEWRIIWSARLVNESFKPWVTSTSTPRYTLRRGSIPVMSVELPSNRVRPCTNIGILHKRLSKIAIELGPWVKSPNILISLFLCDLWFLVLFWANFLMDSPFILGHNTLRTNIAASSVQRHSNWNTIWLFIWGLFLFTVIFKYCYIILVSFILPLFVRLTILFLQMKQQWYGTLYICLLHLSGPTLTKSHSPARCATRHSVPATWGMSTSTSTQNWMIWTRTLWQLFCNLNCTNYLHSNITANDHNFSVVL